jgi:hypothetical protein
MDADQLARDRGRVAYAIPSPARRADPADWAVTPVPLLAADARREARRAG